MRGRSRQWSILGASSVPPYPCGFDMSSTRWPRLDFTWHRAELCNMARGLGKDPARGKRRETERSSYTGPTWDGGYEVHTLPTSCPDFFNQMHLVRIRVGEIHTYPYCTGQTRQITQLLLWLPEPMVWQAWQDARP